MSSSTAEQPLIFWEWIRVIRRIELGFNPSPKGDPKKFISSSVVQHVAVMAATYGNPDGTEVRPGIARLAKVCRVDPTIVGRCLDRLRDLGLMVRVFCGGKAGRAAKADVHRLAIPGDLVEKVAMLDPDEDELVVPDGVEAPSRRVSRQRRAAATGDPAQPGTPGAAPAAGPDEPVDNRLSPGAAPGDTGPPEKEHPVLPHRSPGAAPDITRCSTAPPTHRPTQDLPHTSSSPYGAEEEGTAAGLGAPSAEPDPPPVMATVAAPPAGWPGAAGPLLAVGRHRRPDQAELDAAYAVAMAELNRDLAAAGPLLEQARSELGADASNALVVVRAHQLSLRRSA